MPAASEWSSSVKGRRVIGGLVLGPPNPCATATIPSTMQAAYAAMLRPESELVKQIPRRGVPDVE